MSDHRMKRPLRAAAAVLALGLGAAVLPGAAQAQFFGGWGGWDNGGTWDGMAPQQVRRAITERGFRVLAPLRRNGSVFVAEVVDQRGQRERLIVAAADAQILQRFIVDDGYSSGGFARGTDDDRALVPPADIPDGGRRVARPVPRDVPAPQFGNLDADGDGEGAAAPEAPSRRAAPPIRTVKPRPRLVERSPDVAVPGREPGAVESTPLAPAAPRPTLPPPVAAVAPAAVAAPAAPKAPAVVASRPEPVVAAPVPQAAATAVAAPAAPATSAVSATASRRMTDPLAIPVTDDAATRPVRSVASGITGTPVAAPAPKPVPAKPGDVPVAPLD